MAGAHRFQSLVEEFTRLMDAAQNDEGRILREGQVLLQNLVAHDDWLEPAHAVPHPRHYQQFLLHCCPASRFSVVSFVWGPGQHTPIHDHTVWGLIGMLRGAELGERYERRGDGMPLVKGSVERLEPGMVDAVSPSVGDIHRVANAYDDRVSISIHVYGADIGAVRRHVFDPETGLPREFVSGYAPVQAV